MPPCLLFRSSTTEILVEEQDFVGIPTKGDRLFRKVNLVTKKYKILDVVDRMNAACPATCPAAPLGSPVAKSSKRSFWQCVSGGQGLPGFTLELRLAAAGWLGDTWVVVGGTARFFTKKKRAVRRQPVFLRKKTGCPRRWPDNPFFLPKKKRAVKPFFKENGLLTRFFTKKKTGCKTLF